MSDWPHVVVLEPHSAGLALARAMVRAGARVTMIAPPGNDWETRSRGVERVVAPFERDGEPWLEAIERLAPRAAASSSSCRRPTAAAS